MIPATELRIGNLSYYHITDDFDTHTKEWDELNTVDADDLKHLTEHPDDPNYKPIPLTEEWLLKAGFHYDEDKSYWSKSHFRIAKGNGVYRSIDFTATDLDYVHQLQNLYFALRGEELQFKK